MQTPNPGGHGLVKFFTYAFDENFKCLCVLSFCLLPSCLTGKNTSSSQTDRHTTVASDTRGLFTQYDGGNVLLQLPCLLTFCPVRCKPRKQCDEFGDWISGSLLMPTGLLYDQTEWVQCDLQIFGKNNATRMWVSSKTMSNWAHFTFLSILLLFDLLYLIHVLIIWKMLLSFGGWIRTEDKSFGTSFYTINFPNVSQKSGKLVMILPKHSHEQ